MYAANKISIGSAAKCMLYYLTLHNGNGQWCAGLRIEMLDLLSNLYRGIGKCRNN